MFQYIALAEEKEWQAAMRFGDQNGSGVNICALCLPPRGKPSTPSPADKPRRGITATKRFALRGLMFRA
ncbi:MAG: hypothetical protein OSB19_12465 [Opitutaceae bacterium]|nr:hypothetical protein [Opitutaceae bacterium]